MRTLPELLLLLIVFVTHPTAWSAENPPFEFAPGQTDQFANATCVLRIRPAVELPPGIVWRLTSEQRTLAQGIAVLKQVKEDKAGENKTPAATLEIQTPEIKNGVVLDVTLSCHLEGDEAEVTLPLRLRGPNPFASVRETLEKSGFTLFDPVGQTEDAFQKLDVTWKTVASLDEIETIEKIEDAPLILIGEGVEWDEALSQRADELVRQGAFLLVLRPEDDSTWPLSLSAEGLSHLRLSRLSESGLAPLKLDVQFWETEALPRAGWELNILDEKMSLAPGIGPQTWPVAEYHTVDKGRCVFVGLPLISQWSASPVPRELLAEILISHLTHLSDIPSAEAP